MMINETLKMLRSIYGMTGRELAQYLEISASYLSEIENGKKAPAFNLLEKYSDVFDLKLSTLILFTEEQNSIVHEATAKTKTRDLLFRFMKFIDNRVTSGDCNENEQDSNSVSD